MELRKQLVRVACLLALPAVEAIGWWLRVPPSALRWSSPVSPENLLLPLALFIALLAALAAREMDATDSGQLRLRPFFFGAHLGTLVLVEAALRLPAAPWAVAFCLGISWLSAFCVWIPASRYLSHSLSAVLVPGSLLVALSVFYDRTPGVLWERLGRLTSAAVVFLSSVIPGFVSTTNPQGYQLVSYRSFIAEIGKACWGMESFFLFTLAYLVVHCLFADRLRRRGWFFCFVGALPLLFVVNAIRIVLLVVAAGLLVEGCGAERGRALFESFVHPYLGWILYGSAFASYGVLWARISVAADPIGRSLRRAAKNARIAVT